MALPIAERRCRFNPELYTAEASEDKMTFDERIEAVLERQTVTTMLILRGIQQMMKKDGLLASSGNPSAPPSPSHSPARRAANGSMERERTASNGQAPSHSRSPRAHHLSHPAVTDGRIARSLSGHTQLGAC
jgi:hypothetical protein